MQKIKNIEFLRTFLTIAIVFHHAFIYRMWTLPVLFPDIPLYQTLHRCFLHANNSVEGFFIIAGFLLILTFKPKTNPVEFIEKKLIRLSPPILFSILICGVGAILHTMPFKVIPNITTVFLLNSAGICLAIGNNPVLWFTSALFVGLFLYFCIIKFSPKEFQLWIMSILVMVSYLIVELLQNGSFDHPLKNYYYVLNIGFLRSVGGIGLGCLIGEMFKNNSDKINNFVPNILQKNLITIIEILLTGFVLGWILCSHKGINNLLFVAGFGLLLILFILNKGFLSQLLNKDIWVFLGKYTYSIYVVHYVIYRILGFSLWKYHTEFVISHPVIPVIVNISTAIFVGIFTYYFVETTCANYLKHVLLSNKSGIKECKV